MVDLGRDLQVKNTGKELWQNNGIGVDSTDWVRNPGKSRGNVCYVPGWQLMELCNCVRIWDVIEERV